MGINQTDVVKALLEKKPTAEAARERLELQYNRRLTEQSARAWLKTLNTPKLFKWARVAWNTPFSVLTLGHAVAPITHAGWNWFIPERWAMQWKATKDSPAIYFSKPAHELLMQKVEQDPNFYLAKRGGLGNDPKRVYDAYQKYAPILGKLGEPGRRSMDVLKSLRQDMFNAEWAKTPESMKNGDMVKLICKLVNHATGLGDIGQGTLAKGAEATMFAPRLEASRLGRIIGDPMKAVGTYFNKNATPEQNYAANLTMKRTAQFLGTYLGLLAANDGLLVATKSKDRVNFFDPSKSDFWRFKVDGLAIDPTGGLTTTLRAIGLLASTVAPYTKPPQYVDKSGNVQVERRVDVVNREATFYARGKEAPAISLLHDWGVREDYAGRSLPNATEEEKEKSEARTGKQPYTWGSYLLETKGPIATSGAIREITETWKSQGMSEGRINQYLKVLATFALEVQGVRVEDAPKPPLKAFGE